MVIPVTFILISPLWPHNGGIAIREAVFLTRFSPYVCFVAQPVDGKEKLVDGGEIGWKL